MISGGKRVIVITGMMMAAGGGKATESFLYTPIPIYVPAL
jgi:hypothetical protein